MITTTPRPMLSASSLRVFDACQRLYEFSSVRPRSWPGPTSQDQEKEELYMETGRQLHQLVHMHAQGMDARALAASSPALARWYECYLESPFSSSGGEVYSEQALSFSVAGRRMVAKLDRIIKDGDRWIIIDWKTSGRAPSEKQLEDDWQAILYPLALAEAGASLNCGEPIAPEQIETVFYYLEPDVQRRLPFNTTLRDHAIAAVEQAIADINDAAVNGFAPTGKTSGRCTKPVCRFYSLCHMAAVPVIEGSSELIDIDDVAERLALLAEFEFDDEPVVL